MSQEFHASRLLTIIPFPVSDLLKPAYSFGGVPLIQMGKPYVDNWLNARQAVADILQGYRSALRLAIGSRAPESSFPTALDEFARMPFTTVNQEASTGRGLDLKHILRGSYT